MWGNRTIIPSLTHCDLVMQWCVGDYGQHCIHFHICEVNVTIYFRVRQNTSTYTTSSSRALSHTRADSRLAPSQWETSLQSNAVSHWLGTNLESALHTILSAIIVWLHYDDVIMSMMASRITSLMMIYSSVYLGADQRKHQSSASLAFEWGIHWWPVNSPHKRPVTRKMFPFDDVIMHYIIFKVLIPSLWYSCNCIFQYVTKCIDIQHFFIPSSLT